MKPRGSASKLPTAIEYVVPAVTLSVSRLGPPPPGAPLSSSSLSFVSALTAVPV
jgi:hypothetical protein